MNLSEDFDENYSLFLQDAIATGCLWVLEGEDGIALCPSLTSPNNEVNVMPLWSQPEYAELHCVDAWNGYKAIPVSLEEFVDDWLTGMHEDVLLVGVNWNEQLKGFEIEPLDLLADIEDF